jgi:hypothetical protein
VEYGTISGVYTFSTVLTSTPSILHIENLDGLQRNQTYYYRVVNFTDGYPDVISNEYSFTTTTPIQISNLSFAVAATTIESTVHSILLSGLNPDTTYYYKVANIYSDFSDGVSTGSSFTTSPETSPTLTQKMRSICIVGGLSGGTIGTTISQVDIYDPVLDIWYPAVTNLPTPVSFAAVASVQGKIYVIGGYEINGNVSVTKPRI